jgi:hypothetical protein
MLDLNGFGRLSNCQVLKFLSTFLKMRCLQLLSVRLIVVLFILTGAQSYAQVFGFRTVIVGDVHGNLKGLKIILKNKSLIDPVTEKWTGKNARLTLMGDLNDRGEETRNTMDFLMGLETQAAEAGGEVKSLVGNHEFMAIAGTNRIFFHENDFSSFNDFRTSLFTSSVKRYQNAFIGDTRYARWLRQRPTIYAIGSNLFVHGSLGKWALGLTIKEVNNIGWEYMRYLQGIGSKPSEKLDWYLSDFGPLRSRQLATKIRHGMPVERKEALDPDTLDTILKQWGMERVFIGHSISPNLNLSLLNATYGAKVVMTDLDLTNETQGRLVAFEIDEKNELFATEYNRQSGEVIQILNQKDAVQTRIPQLKCKFRLEAK